MNTLRVKIALLMVVAIVSVVGLLTAVLFYLLGPPKRLHSLSPVGATGRNAGERGRGRP